MRQVLLLTWVLLASLALFSCSDSGQRKITDDYPSKFFEKAGRTEGIYEPGNATVLKDGRIYLANSGSPRILQMNAEIYDPKTGKSKKTARMPCSFDSAPSYPSSRALTLADGRVLLMGSFWVGCDEKVDVKTTALIYDPLKDNYKALSEPELARRSSFNLLLENGNVVIIGGNAESKRLEYRGMPRSHPDKKRFINWARKVPKSVLLFDPRTEKLKKLGQLNVDRIGAVAIPLNKKELLIFGGKKILNSEEREAEYIKWGLDPKGNREQHMLGEKFPPVGYATEVELFNLETGQSKIVGEIKIGREHLQAFKLKTEKVLLLGGQAIGRSPEGRFELYDLKTHTSKMLSNINETLLPSGEVLVYERLGRSGDGRDARGVELPDGNILLVSWTQGRQEAVSIFNATKEEVINIDATIQYRFAHHLVKTPSNDIFLLGGTLFLTEGNGYKNLVEKFNYEKFKQFWELEYGNSR